MVSILPVLNTLISLSREKILSSANATHNKVQLFLSQYAEYLSRYAATLKKFNFYKRISIYFDSTIQEVNGLKACLQDKLSHAEGSELMTNLMNIFDKLTHKLNTLALET